PARGLVVRHRAWDRHLHGGHGLQPAGRRAARLPRPPHPARSRRQVTALLAVEELSLGFSTEAGFASVLDRVSLSIQRGNIVGLVGGSGCGKPTRGRAVWGGRRRASARSSGGRVLFRGAALLTADPALVNQTVRGRAITFVPQDPFTSFNPVFTVGEQIREILKWKSPRAAEPTGRAWLPTVIAPYPADRKRA